MSTAVLLCVQSAVATAADAHTDSGGLHITAHLLHTVQDTSGQWCVERVMERETLSNNTEYQERLREDRIKGALWRSSWERDRRDDTGYSDEDTDEENKVLNDRLHQVQDQLVKVCVVGDSDTG